MIQLEHAVIHPQSAGAKRFSNFPQRNSRRSVSSRFSARCLVPFLPCSVGSLDQLAQASFPKIRPRAQLNIPVNLPATLEQTTRIRELGTSHETQLYS